MSAVGGLILFTSALFFVLVMLFTVTSGKKLQPVEPVEFAEPLEAPSPRAALFDRLGLWTVVAVILVLLAYGYPIYHQLQMPRYGSPGFTPF